MIDRLKEILRTDDFIPTSAVFPDIDTDRISRELKLKDLGAERGKKNLPHEDEETLDSVEMSIVSRIEESRRKGLQNYETNREAYARRLSGASSAHLEVKRIAGAARGDFQSEVKGYRGQMAGPVDNLRRWQTALMEFQKKHGLTRPAFQDASFLKTAAIIFFCILIETALNGYLFAQKNDLGLLGGFMVALLVSIVNVGVSALSGYFAHLMNHRNLLIKAAGLVIILAWIAGAFTLNLGVAHFRDAVETIDGWSLAAQTSAQTLMTTPFDLKSIESWLLMFWGCLIALGTFLKFVYYGEPYPGYGRITERREEALQYYADLLEHALDSLKESRDTAAEDLQDANETVRSQITDAVDALYGQRMMAAHLGTFLQQCDLQTTALLKTYRDENRAARDTDAPRHFDDNFIFAPFKPADIDVHHRAYAEKEVAKISEIIDKAIDDIHSVYEQIIDDYPNPDKLIGIDMQTGQEDDNVRPARERRQRSGETGEAAV